MAGELVIPAHVLDAKEIILGRHLGHRDQLHPVFLPTGGIEQQVAEVAGALTLAKRLPQFGDVPLILQRVSDVHDETGMATVLIVPAAKQGGRLVQQGRIQPAHIVGDAVDLLVDIAFHNVAHPTGGQRLLLPGLGNPPILVQIQRASGVLGAQMVITQHPADPILHRLQVAVAKNQIVQRQPGEARHTQFRMRDEAGAQDVALHLDGRGVMHAGPIDPRQPIEGQRRLIPAAVVHRLQVVEHLPLR
ncbi:hypothetical protein D3C77_08960 [compost metagenome]